MEMERTIVQGFKKVIIKIGEEEGYTLVLEKNESIVLFSSKAIDFTDRVIKPMMRRRNDVKKIISKSEVRNRNNHECSKFK